ncbi:ATP-binding protein [Haloplanus rubicundus]|uniref:ATP-binding protein n=1 Tax=Haloplanus rubicundus TaxID=1547898 RepID=A0A345E4U4_9EURY|nr:ATP-binding protein [Haloplanus rubicundus]AXG07216.1 ATP-binding protein [Haloplanus rubicundus]
MSDNTDDILDRDPVTDDETSTDTDTADSSGDEAAATGTETNDQTTVPETTVPNSLTDADENELGHVVASEEIHVTRSDYKVNAFVKTNCRDNVRVGDYVQIPYPVSDPTKQADELFAVVDGLRYEPYTELDDKSDTHNRIASAHTLDETEFVLIAELEPIAIIASTDTGLERSVVNKIPKPNTPVALSLDEEYLRTGLNIPQDGVFAGYLSVGGDRMTVDGDPLPYFINNPGVDPVTEEIESGEPAIFRHTLVAGSTGKGKTHFTKNLLRQFATDKRYPIENHQTGDTERSRLNLVILDPENEYSEMRNDNPEINEDDISGDIEVGGIDNFETFIPDIGNTNAPSTGESRNLTIPFSLVEHRPQLLMPYKPTEVTRGAIENCIQAYFDDTDAPTYDGFLQFLRTNEDSESPLRQRYNIEDGTWSAIMRRVTDAAYRDVFDHGTNPLPDVSNAVFREGQVTVIPTSHLHGAKEELTVLSILSYIIDNKIDDYNVDPNVKDTPLLVAVDEAHNYVSDPNTLREQYIVNRARDAVKQGRKDKLGLFMITQNPEDIDGDILKQTNTNIFLGLREEVITKVPSIPRGYEQDLQKYGKGQAVIKAPDVEAVEVKGLPYCLTQHSN